MRRALFLLLLALAPAFPQGRSNFLPIARFRGTVSYNTSFQGKSDVGGDVTMTASATANFVIERVSGSTPTWQGRLVNSTSSVSLDGRSSFGTCNSTESFTIVGPLLPDSGRFDARIQMFSNNWNFNLAAHRGPEQLSRVVTVCENPALNRTQEIPASLYLPSWLENLPYPSGSGTRLFHSGRVEEDADFSGYLYHHLSSVVWHYTITIEPDEGDLKLEISSYEYDSWRPSAKADGSPGDPIVFTARLLRMPSREEAPQDVRRFEWELVNTSQEPGVAMNWPQEAKDSDFDLRFRPEGDQTAETERRQKMSRLVRNTATDRAVVEPVDWGGWSVLRVTVELIDGRKITGEYRTTGDKDIRLPKRRAGSLIADKFREEHDANGADNSDDEKRPSGDVDGDGLTLYQEYRGFYVDGNHTTADPKRKDYFAVNLNRLPEVDAGLDHFGRVTGLKVWRDLRPEETAKDRTINHNRRAGPHRAPQHAVIFRRAGYKGYAAAEGGPGTPKQIRFVGLPDTIPERATGSPKVSFAAAVVAHEALHTVNVWHHGESDVDVTWSSWTGSLAEIRYNRAQDSFARAEITVLDESGNNITEEVKQKTASRGWSCILGEKSGQHSGVENCLMRYFVANTYAHASQPNVRYLLPREEIVGAGLCEQAKGDGVNDPGRKPQPRYFDAASGRGNCRSQIQVNDAVPAPKR
jgi:hypothetical protein